MQLAPATRSQMPAAAAGGRHAALRRELAQRLPLLHAIDFVHDRALPRVRLEPVVAPVAVHPVCSVRKMGLADKLTAVVRCAAQAVGVDEAQCCGFAGDRGFNRPELGAHALRHLRAALPAGCTGGVSSSRTCERPQGRAAPSPPPVGVKSSWGGPATT